jgi:hypothetical protein
VSSSRPSASGVKQGHDLCRAVSNLARALSVSSCEWQNKLTSRGALDASLFLPMEQLRSNASVEQIGAGELGVAPFSFADWNASVRAAPFAGRGVAPTAAFAHHCSFSGLLAGVDVLQLQGC